MGNTLVEPTADVLVKSVHNAIISVDKAKGVVEAFAAAIGNKDSVGDIIVPGAFDASLRRRKPRVVWGHNWNEPIGKVLEVTEVSPSDPRLPKKMRDAGVGGLFVKVQFNLASERGREAFSSVLFFGEDQEWSIGYKTIRGDFDPARNANLLKEVELYEVSPVLHGANNLTGTISIKGGASSSTTSTEPGYAVGDFFTSGNVVSSGSWDFDMKTAFVEEREEPEEKTVDEDEAIKEAFERTLGDIENVKFPMPGQVVFDKPGRGTWMSRYRRDGHRLRMTRPVMAKPQIIYVPVDVVADPGSEPLGGVCPKCGQTIRERHKGEEEKREFPGKKRRAMAERGTAMPDGSFPISSIEDLKNAIKAVGRAKDPEAAKRHIRKRAAKLNAEYLLPDSWKSGEPDGLETKAGRVISSANMGKLRRASELLNEVVSAGIVVEKPTMEEEAEEKKSLVEQYTEWMLDSNDDAILGTSETLVGKSVSVLPSQNTTVGVSSVVASVGPLAEKYGWIVAAPGLSSIAEKAKPVEIHISTDDNMAEQMKELAAALKDAEAKSVRVRVEDFYGTEVKTFGEVFNAK